MERSPIEKIVEAKAQLQLSYDLSQCSNQNSNILYIKIDIRLSLGFLGTMERRLLPPNFR